MTITGAARRPGIPFEEGCPPPPVEKGQGKGLFSGQLKVSNTAMPWSALSMLEVIR